MTAKKLLAATILITFACSAVSADFCAKAPVLSTTDAKGARIGLVIAREDFEASPSWQPGKLSVPLTIEKALEIATRANKSSSTTLFESVELRSYSCNRGPHYWFYVFTFEEPTDDPTVIAKSSTIGVLLSGKVIRMTALKEGN